MASLSTAGIDMQPDQKHRWTENKPGLVFKSLETKTKPAGQPAARLRQMKRIAAEFSAAIFDANHGKEQLRLLPRPVHRYADQKNKITDGTIFSFSSYGTNPAVLLVIEAETGKDSPPGWRYAVTAMTAAEVAVSRDGKEIWKVPGTPPLGQRSENPWTWFFVTAG